MFCVQKKKQYRDKRGLSLYVFFFLDEIRACNTSYSFTPPLLEEPQCRGDICNYPQTNEGAGYFNRVNTSLGSTCIWGASALMGKNTLIEAWGRAYPDPRRLANLIPEARRESLEQKYRIKKTWCVMNCNQMFLRLSVFLFLGLCCRCVFFFFKSCPILHLWHWCEPIYNITLFQGLDIVGCVM